MYNSSQKQRWDAENQLDYALKEGLQRGMEKGVKQGIKQGRLKTQNDVAVQLKKMNMRVEDIAKATKLSIQEIAAL